MSEPLQPALTAYNEAAAATFTKYFKPSLDACSGVSFQLVFGAIVGTVAIYISNDSRAQSDMDNGTTTADWTDITSSLTAIGIGNPAGVAGSTLWNIGNLRTAFLKFVYTHGSGTAYGRLHYCAVGH